MSLSGPCHRASTAKLEEKKKGVAYATRVAYLNRRSCTTILYAQKGYRSRIEQHVSRIQPPAKLRRDQLQYEPMGTQCCMEQKVHGPCSRTIPAAAMGCLGTICLPEGFQIQGRPGGSNPTNGERNTTAPANPPDNLFMQCLGRPQRDQAPPQNAEPTRRALEEWERTICENQAIAILEKIQEGRPALF